MNLLKRIKQRLCGHDLDVAFTYDTINGHKMDITCNLCGKTWNYVEITLPKATYDLIAKANKIVNS